MDKGAASFAADAPRPLRRLGPALAGVLFLWGMLSLPLRVMGPGLDLVPGPLTDSRLNNLQLEHGCRWLAGKERSFWNAPFFYPEPNTMAFSDTHLGTLPLYSLFRLTGLDRETAFQAWWLALFALNYLCCLWSLKKLCGGWLGAAAGAYVFAFSLPVAQQLSHPQLLARFAVPLAFLCAWRYMNRPRPTTFAALCLMALLQFYCTVYIGWFLVLGLAAFVLAGRIVPGDVFRLRRVFHGGWRAVALHAAILAASLLLALPLVLPHLRAARLYGYWQWSAVAPMVPRWRSYLFPPDYSLMWNWLLPLGRSLPYRWEHRLFVGALPWLAMVAALSAAFRKRKDPPAILGLVAALSLLMLIVLTLDLPTGTYYRGLTILPGAGAIRAVARVILVMLFFFALTLSLLLSRVETYVAHNRWPAWAAGALGLAAMCAVAADQAPHYPRGWAPGHLKHEAQLRSEILARHVQSHPEARCFVYMPSERSAPPELVHLDAMAAAQQCGIPTINGYSGIMPHTFTCGLFTHYWARWALDHWIFWSKHQRAMAHPGNSAAPHDDPFAGLVIIGAPGGPHGQRLSFVGGPLPESAFKCEVLASPHRLAARPGERIWVKVTVSNLSESAWPAFGRPDGSLRVNVGYRWWTPQDELLRDPGYRHPLPEDLEPGQSVTIDVPVQALDKPGSYILEFDVVQELVAWFGRSGGRPAQLEVLLQ